MRKLWMLCATASFGLLACMAEVDKAIGDVGIQEQVAAVVHNAQTADPNQTCAGKVAGSFMQDWLSESYKTEADWIAAMKTMQELGMKYLLLQGPMRKQEMVGGKAKPVEPFEPDVALFKHCMRAAKETGIKLIIGLSPTMEAGKGYMDSTFSADAAAVKSDVESAHKTLTGIYSIILQGIRDGEIGHWNDWADTIYGWYFHPEFYNANVNSATLNIELYKEQLSGHLNEYIKIVDKEKNEKAHKDANPDDPSKHYKYPYTYTDPKGDIYSLTRRLVMSPFIIPKEAAKEEDYENTRTFLIDLFNRIDFRGSDILMPQDSFGTYSDNNAGKTISPDRMKRWIEAFRNAATGDAAKGIKGRGIFFWINNEIFECSEAGKCPRPLPPMPVKRFEDHYWKTDTYVKDNGEHFVFSWNHQYNPLQAGNHDLGYLKKLCKEEYDNDPATTPEQCLQKLHNAFKEFVCSDSPAPKPPTTLNVGERLNPGEELVSPNGQFRLVMQPSGSLELLSASGTILWTSFTPGKIGAYAEILPGGNLVIRTDTKIIWMSITAKSDATFVRIEDDGYFALYKADGSLVRRIP